MIVLLVASLTLNLAAAAVLLVQKCRHDRAARSACTDCPFVSQPAAARIPAPVLGEVSPFGRG